MESLIIIQSFGNDNAKYYMRSIVLHCWEIINNRILFSTANIPLPRNSTNYRFESNALNPTCTTSRDCIVNHCPRGSRGNALDSSQKGPPHALGPNQFHTQPEQTLLHVHGDPKLHVHLYGDTHIHTQLHVHKRA